MASNKIAFLDAPATPLRIADAPMPEPGPNDVVIKNRAIAINPIDYMQQATGYFLKNYPHVLGSDIAGTVHSVGSAVTKFKAGDRVVGHAWSFMTSKPQDGAYSLYTSLPAANSAIIPPGVDFKEAAVLPMAIDTATFGLHLTLGL